MTNTLGIIICFAYIFLMIGIAEGFRHLGYADDHEINAAEWIVYDALYAYCQAMVRTGKPDGAFKD